MNVTLIIMTRPLNCLVLGGDHILCIHDQILGVSLSLSLSLSREREREREREMRVCICLHVHIIYYDNYVMVLEQ